MKADPSLPAMRARSVMVEAGAPALHSVWTGNDALARTSTLNKKMFDAVFEALILLVAGEGAPTAISACDAL